MYFGIIFIPTHQLQTLTSFLWSSHLKCLNFWTSWPIATKTNTPESWARYDTMPVSRTAYRRRIYRKCFDRDLVLIIAFLFHVRSLTSFLWSSHLKCLNFWTSWPIATKTNTPESWARYDTMRVKIFVWWKDVVEGSISAVRFYQQAKFLKTSCIGSGSQSWTSVCKGKEEKESCACIWHFHEVV